MAKTARKMKTCEIRYVGMMTMQVAGVTEPKTCRRSFGWVSCAMLYDTRLGNQSQVAYWGLHADTTSVHVQTQPLMHDATADRTAQVQTPNTPMHCTPPVTTNAALSRSMRTEQVLCACTEAPTMAEWVAAGLRTWLPRRRAFMPWWPLSTEVTCRQPVLASVKLYHIRADPGCRAHVSTEQMHVTTPVDRASDANVVHVAAASHCQWLR